MSPEHREMLTKVPAVTFGFWITKILATTLGETGGDAVSMSMDMGYLVGTAIFFAVFLAAVLAQVSARRFHPVLYWATIVATTTLGTTLADLVDRSLGIGYAGGATILVLALAVSLWAWHWRLGSIAIDSVGSLESEVFYWTTIMCSQTLGTALGDWTADTMALGYDGAALVFGALLAAIAATYRWTRVSPTALFWSAFVLTRPLGAVVGDFLDKPASDGGLELSRYLASAILIGLIGLCLLMFPQRPASKGH